MTVKHTENLIQVPPRLTTAEAAGLKAMLAGCKGQPVVLDFVSVTQVGSQCLQVLLAAREHWCANGQTFEVRNVCGGVRDTLSLLGVSPGQIGAREAGSDA